MKLKINTVEAERSVILQAKISFSLDWDDKAKQGELSIGNSDLCVSEYWQPVSIILTDNSEIKEGDYYVVELYNNQFESTGMHMEKCESIGDTWINSENVSSTRHIKNCRKITASNIPNIGYPIDEKDYPEIVRLFNLGEDVEVEIMQSGELSDFMGIGCKYTPIEMVELSQSGCIVLKEEAEIKVLKKSFYCKIHSGSMESIDEWNDTQKSLKCTNLTEKEKQDILFPKVCKNQCFDCMAEVGSRRLETKKLIKITKEEFQKRRTQIISEMLDNPDENGIYPTTECFEKLDALFDEVQLTNAR